MFYLMDVSDTMVTFFGGRVLPCRSGFAVWGEKEKTKVPGENPDVISRCRIQRHQTWTSGFSRQWRRASVLTTTRPPIPDPHGIYGNLYTRVHRCSESVLTPHAITIWFNEQFLVNDLFRRGDDIMLPHMFYLYRLYLHRVAPCLDKDAGHNSNWPTRVRRSVDRCRYLNHTHQQSATTGGPPVTYDPPSWLTLHPTFHPTIHPTIHPGQFDDGCHVPKCQLLVKLQACHPARRSVGALSGLQGASIAGVCWASFRVCAWIPVLCQRRHIGPGNSKQSARVEAPAIRPDDSTPVMTKHLSACLCSNWRTLVNWESGGLSEAYPGYFGCHGDSADTALTWGILGATVTQWTLPLVCVCVMKLRTSQTYF